MTLAVNRNKLDVAQIFQTGMAFCGDIERTAAATFVSRKVVQALAASERWTEKIAEWNQLREGDPKDPRIQINRAVNQVQAHRLRAILDKVITYLSTRTEEELANKSTASERGELFGQQRKGR